MYQAAVLNKSKINPYLTNQVLQSSPEQLLIKVYDYAIVNAEKKDMIKTNTAIQELIGFLRFDDESYKGLAVNLLNLYQYCQDQARKNNFTVVSKVLSQLRESWLEAININKAVA
jgi:flagellar secretion chaperone FliS